MSRGGGLRPASALGHMGDRSLAGGDEDTGDWVTIVSKFHFVDLAGSERVSVIRSLKRLPQVSNSHPYVVETNRSRWGEDQGGYLYQ